MVQQKFIGSTNEFYTPSEPSSTNASVSNVMDAEHLNSKYDLNGDFRRNGFPPREDSILRKSSISYGRKFKISTTSREMSSLVFLHDE